MTEPPVHRKRVRHFNEPGHAHELTFSCYLRMPLLVRDPWRILLSRSIDAAVEKQAFQLIAFVYMPEHIHLIVFPRQQTAKVESLLYAIKRPFSFRIKHDLQATRDPLLETLTIQERPGKWTFRFWQEGPGYDRNLTSLDAALAAVEYIHNNPVRRGLCLSPHEWRWSSWKHYHRPTEAPDLGLPKVHGMLV
jgi:putative transposase